MKIAALLLFLTGCGVTWFGLSALEIRRLDEIGYDVYGCSLHRNVGIFPAASTMWLITPKGTPVQVMFADCDTLKLN